MSADPDFDAAIAWVLRDEGGYVNDPKDSGGETNMGICARDYPNENIANMTVERATEIYRADWWDKYGFGQLTTPIGAKVFDLAVNMGAKWAVKLLQTALNALGAATVKVDGALGAATVKVANACIPVVLMHSICAAAEDHYRAIVDSHPNDAKFLRGWLKRANEES